MQDTAVSETPFLGLADEPYEWGTEAPAGQAPFLAEYRLGDQVVDAGREAAEALMAELLDPEFEEALEELLDEADAEVERLGTDETPAGDARALRLLERWAEPIAQEAEALLERMATELEHRELTALTEAELDAQLAGFGPDNHQLPPVAEDFLGKLVKKAGRAVKGAVKLAKKGVTALGKLVPIGALLRRLRALVRPLLRRVVTMALDRLPPALRPYAARLARRFTGEQADLDEAGLAAPAAPAMWSVAHAFDAELAALMLAPGEQEGEESSADVVAPAESDHLAELDDARARFVQRMEGLQEGENPTPLVEEFVPALLPVLRIGLRIVGRPKVVSFLARYLGRLIAPLVGPQITPALSHAIVDAGLRLLTLEEPGEAEVEPVPRLAAEAFANVVEDTVRRVAELSDEELADEAAVESAAYEGFQAGVAAAFPGTVLDPANEHLETTMPMGSWVSMPRGRRVRYRKYTRVFPVAISAQTARTIRTFGGRSLYGLLRAHFVHGGVVRGRLHLYQAVPGTRIGRVVRVERRAGRVGRSVRSHVHPLTREAAGLLVGEPGLGHDLDETQVERAEPVAVGQRLYLLELADGAAVASRASDAALTLDPPADAIRVAVYLSEPDAQQIAARLRRREPPGAVLTMLRRVYGPALAAAMRRSGDRVTVVRENVDTLQPEAFAGGLLRAARQPARAVALAVECWVSRALAGELVRRPDTFIEASAAPADGVSVLVTLERPPALRAIAAILRGGVAGGVGSLRDLQAALRGVPTALVEIRPGYHRA